MKTGSGAVPLRKRKNEPSDIHVSIEQEVLIRDSRVGQEGARIGTCLILARLWICIVQCANSIVGDSCHTVS